MAILTEGFHNFLRSLQANFWITWLVAITSFQIIYSSSFVTISSETLVSILKMLLNKLRKLREWFYSMGSENQARSPLSYWYHLQKADKFWYTSWKPVRFKFRTATTSLQREKTCPSATFSTINQTWLDLGSNPGRRDGKPATNRLSYSTAL
jgi:hypothetical protein